MGNNDYSLIRYFAKTKYWGQEPFIAIKELSSKDYLVVSNDNYGNNHYQLTQKGWDFLSSYQLPQFIDSFALEIDATGFVRKIAYKLEGKEPES